VGYNSLIEKIITEIRFTSIQRYQCSKIFLASIQVATTDNDVMNESHSGTGESVYRDRIYHVPEYNKMNTAVRIKPVTVFSLVT